MSFLSVLVRRLANLSPCPATRSLNRMELKPKEPTAKGPPDWFTGDVWMESIVQADEHSPLNVAAVHFTPGARTAWHVHDGGQTLYVTDGEGRVQARGESIIAIRAGDVVHTPSGEWHWHGAAPDHWMTHLSLTEGPATWGDHITDEEYRGR
jgi:quercetin dioxygenase-like cupin family protein